MHTVPAEPKDRSIANRFLSQAENVGEALAITDSTGARSYRNVAERAIEVARLLDRSGVPEGVLVGLSVSRGWRVVAGIMGIWIHGCAYVPIDPDYPARRRGFIADDARVSHVLTDDAESGLALTRLSSTAPPHALPEATAYVMYTSGSTGTPKGVMVTHHNLLALLDGAASVMPADATDTGTVFHSYCFDFSVWEIWRLLTVGGHCVYVSKENTFDGNRFAELLSAERISILNLVPSVFANLVRVLGARPVSLPSLREVVFGGEPVNIGAVKAWYELGLAPGAELINMYGITETTVHVTAKRLGRQDIAADRAGTPIGRPLPHLEVALLDGQGRSVPPNSTGEVYVTGAGVSAGYLDRPGLTAERFVYLPGEPRHRRWYRTGDLALLDDHGELVFIGRRDNQVQLRGYRIELGEIEAALRQLPGVADGAAAVVPNRLGEPVLVGCYVPAAGVGSADAAVFRRTLIEQLPRHMVPVRLVPIARLPVTPEGKLDRAALADIVITRGNGSTPA
jgi:D-alanine--poly(phosphoribitol) ligase subunit 1